MTRAKLLQEAIVEGLIANKESAGADLVAMATFAQIDEGRIVVFSPRRRLEPLQPVSIEDLGRLRELIDEGSKIHGFLDAVILKP